MIVSGVCEKYLSIFILCLLFCLSQCASSHEMIRITPTGDSVAVAYTATAMPKKEGQNFTSQMPAKLVPQAFDDIRYIHFAFEGSCRIDIRPGIKVNSVNVSPHRYNIKPVLNDNQLSMNLTESAKLVITFNEQDTFFIFADPLEKGPPNPLYADVVSIADFDVDNTASSLSTKRIQNAIDTLPENATLYVPAGKYLTGTVFLKSNMNLYLAPGAELRGSPERSDYKNGHDTLIYMKNAANVKLSGSGTINANGRALRKQGRRGNVFRAVDCENITIEGLIFKDSPSWNTRLINCQNVHISNLKIINSQKLTNTDGIDPDDCRHVWIENCFGYCGDDPVVIKSTGKSDEALLDVYDITVKGNVFMTLKNALKVGTETVAAKMYDITFIDNDILYADRGMAVCCRDGADISNIRFINNRFERSLTTGGVKERLIDFYIEHRKGKGRIHDILIKDCHAEGYWPQQSTMLGLDEAHQISNVLFENFTIGDKICKNAQQARLKTNEHVSNITFTE